MSSDPTITTKTSIDDRASLTKRAPDLPANANAVEAATSRVAVVREDGGINVPQLVDQAPRDIYQESLRTLRSRYPLAIILGLAGAVLGVAAGYLFRPPLYRSEGLLRIAYT